MLLLALGTLLVLSAAGVAQDGRVFEFCSESELKTLDPHAHGDFLRFVTSANMFDGLTRWQGQPGSLEPWLATDWESNEDATVWTFHLREGVLFHDGSEMTSEDVLYSIERLLYGGQGYAGTLGAIITPGSTVAPDSHTVVFNLTRSYAPFPLLSQFIFVLNKGVLERHAQDGDYGATWLAQNGSKLGADGVGTGAYVLTEWVPGNYLTFEPFAQFWLGWDQPHMRAVRITVVHEIATRVLGLKTGQFHYASATVTYDIWQDMLQSDLMVPIEEPFPKCYYISFNNMRLPTSDLHFRKALCYLVDYETFIETIAHGFFDRNIGYIPRLLLGSLDPATEPFYYTYDPAKADEELAKVPFDYTEYELVFGIESGYAEHKMLAEMLIYELEKRDIKARMELATWPTWVEAVSDPATAYHVAPMGLSPLYLDPDHFSRLADPRGFGQYFGASWYENPAVTALHEQAVATTDPAVRAALYQEAQRIELSEAGHAWIGQQKYITAINKDIGGTDNFSPYGALMEFRELYFKSEWED